MYLGLSKAVKLVLSCINLLISMTACTGELCRGIIQSAMQRKMLRPFFFFTFFFFVKASKKQLFKS